MMKEEAAYDNLPAKQSRPEVPPRHTRDFLLDPTTCQPKNRTSMISTGVN
jgi:hypothetical protein